MEPFGIVLIIVAAVVASQPVASLLKVVPLPIVQIAIGAFLAWPLTGGVHIELEPELFLLVFIPPLLFSDAWAAPKREFWQLRWPIAAMAIGLVFFTIASFGFALYWLLPSTPLAVAFAAAAVLSPTDAVAVSSIVDESKLPPRLLHLLQGESLFNDASGLVMFRFAVAAALTGAFSPAEALLSFATAVVVGILAGFTCLWFSSRALKILAKLKNGAAESQVLIILILPFLAYLLAELFHASGVLAAVTAGLFGGRYGMTRHIGVSARMLMTSAWHMLAFALNGAIFVFLGLQLPAIAARIPPEIAGGPGSMGPALIVLALTLCLMALRSAFMFGGGVISRIRYWFTKRQPDPRFTTRMNLVAAVGGVRGAITLAGVLSLPLALNDGSAFPARDLVIFLAAGVIVFWLVIAALTLPFLTAGFSHMGHERAADEMRAARIAAAEGAIAKLEEMSGGVEGDEMAITTRQAVASQLIAHYRRRIVALEQGENLGQEQLAARKAEAELRGAAIAAEMDTLRRMLRSGQINDQTLQALFRDLTLGQAMIASHTER